MQQFKPTDAEQSILNTLDAELKTKALEVLNKCQAQGINMRPTFGLRSVYEQGKLWRQSRTSQEVRDEIASLRKQDCDFLANAIEKPGPSTGPHVTNAIPGLSWHQWGLALDCMWLYDGIFVPMADDARVVNGRSVQGYHIYSDIVSSCGLTSGGKWQSIKDYPHMQLYPDDSPLSKYSLKEINDILSKKYGKGESK